MVADRQPRGQIILIGAISLAFIILGIVVVFNGVLYTETLSSGPVSQSGPDATVTDLEIERGVSCALAKGGNGKSNVSAFNDAYRNMTGESRPVAVNVSDLDVNMTPSDPRATITITYDSHESSYERNRTITASDCPTEEP
ncbi:hypothetical protein A6E15_10325 [Natrinema saccharevitans]|uniref:Uncharacterized protein n=1 Tax=Natrinema saccharevitans TaxID=301967 RepID=A0A1S8AXS3_9EURY|nr:hypothetical protein [Natrinema saccharevitans]OLZ41359.1 hypothetical protein A6E15_10325 [Natrinema saccharevitans]